MRRAYCDTTERFLARAAEWPVGAIPTVSIVGFRAARLPYGLSVAHPFSGCVIWGRRVGHDSCVCFITSSPLYVRQAIAGSRAELGRVRLGIGTAPTAAAVCQHLAVTQPCGPRHPVPSTYDSFPCSRPRIRSLHCCIHFPCAKTRNLISQIAAVEVFPLRGRLGSLRCMHDRWCLLAAAELLAGQIVCGQVVSQHAVKLRSGRCFPPHHIRSNGDGAGREGRPGHARGKAQDCGGRPAVTASRSAVPVCRDFSILGISTHFLASASGLSEDSLPDLKLRPFF